MKRLVEHMACPANCQLPKVNTIELIMSHHVSSISGYSHDLGFREPIRLGNQLALMLPVDHFHRSTPVLSSGGHVRPAKCAALSST